MGIFNDSGPTDYPGIMNGFHSFVERNTTAYESKTGPDPCQLGSVPRKLSTFNSQINPGVSILL